MTRYFLVCLVCLIALARPAAAQGFASLLSVQTGTFPLDAVAFSPDGTLVATGGRDGLIRLWSVSTGETVWKMPGHTSQINGLAFSPDGTMLASGSRDGVIMLWRTDTHERLKVLTQHHDEVMALAFTPDSRLLFSGSRDATLAIYDIAGDTVVQTLDNFGGGVWDLAVAPDGNSVAVAGEDGTIWLYGLNTPNAWVKRLSGHEAPVASVAFSSDGKRLVSGALDGTVRLWDITPDDIDLKPVLTMRGHLAPIMGAGFSEDNSVVISVSLDGTVRLWDIDNRKTPGVEIASYRTDGTPLTGLTVDITHVHAAVVGTNGMVSLWDTSIATLDALKPKEAPVVIQQPTVQPQTQTSAPPAAPEQLTGRSLYIPVINLRSSVTSFPLGAETWILDPWEKRAGHLEGTAWIHDTGNIVLGGHSEYPDGSAGIFRRLYNVGIGDEIYLSDEGIQRRYMVVNVLTVDYTDVSVVYPTAFNRLTLITCDIPSYDAASGLYSGRLVIVADEVSP